MAANSQFSIAIHILTMLAEHEGENVKSECLAGSVNTNAVVIRRLMCQLAGANIVVSQTGAAGGTRLAKRPADIHLDEVFGAVSHGEVFALHPNTPNQDCPIGKNIESVLCNLQKEIDRSVSDTLGRYTLQTILEQVEQGIDGPQGHAFEQGPMIEPGQA